VQVVADRPVIAGERSDERPAVAAVAQRERGELKPRGPALGPLLQHLDVGGFEIECERAVEQPVGLSVVEAQIAGAKLRELAGRAKAPERQRRLGAGRDHELELARHVTGQERDRGVDQLVRDDVVVVEDEHDRGGQLAQLVDELREDHLDQPGSGVGSAASTAPPKPGTTVRNPATT